MNQDVAETTNATASGDVEVDSYVERLGLDADPFSSEFESDYFYDEADRRRLLDQVIHLARFSDQLVILTGATGVGTSSVLDEMFIQLQDVMECCDVNAEKEGLLDQMLSVLADQLHFQFPQPLTPENFIEALKADTYLDVEPEPILLAIDQAHFISTESLEALHLLKQLAGNMVKLVLVGEFQVEQLALLAGFNHEQISILQLEPLSAAQSADYLYGLFTAAGYKGGGELPLSNDQLAVLYEQSKGNIAEINRLAPALLVADKPIVKVGNRFAIPLPHIIAAGILFAGLMLSYFYNSDEPVTIPTDSVEVDLLSEPQRMVRKVELLKEKDKSQLALVKKKESKPVENNLADSIPTNKTPSLANIPETQSDALARAKSIQADPAVPAEIASKAEELEDDSRVKAILEVAEPKATTEFVNADATKSVEPSQSQQAKVAETASRAAETKEPLQAIAVVERSVKYKEVSPEVASTEVSVISEYSAREQRLLNMSKSNYMLQLFGAYEEERVREFVKKYVGRLSITYFETRYQGQPWYVAITGPYNDREQAKVGATELPASLQRQKPWARSVANIQSDIKTRN